MEYQTFVTHCCGLNAFVRLPRTKEMFLQEAKRNMKRYGDGDRVVGSHVMATTNHKQRSQEAYLEELGFTRVSRERNTRSGNYVSVWLMSRAKFNRSVKRYFKNIPDINRNANVFGR